MQVTLTDPVWGLVHNLLLIDQGLPTESSVAFQVDADERVQVTPEKAQAAAEWLKALSLDDLETFCIGDQEEIAAMLDGDAAETATAIVEQLFEQVGI